MAKLGVVTVILLVVVMIKDISCMYTTRKRYRNGTRPDNYYQYPEVDVLVLGAGYSAMGAAHTLYNRGVRNFLVLEAKDYIGGRCKEAKFGDKTIPIGAGWIHKIEENHIVWQLAKKHKLTLFNDTYSFDSISFRHGQFGYRFNKWYVKRNEKIMRWSLKKCLDFSEEEVKSGHMELSLRDCLQWAGWDIHTFQDEKMRESIDYFMFDFENGGMPEDISAWQISYTGEGEDRIVNDDRGYFYPMEQEIRPFRHKIRLNTEIASIMRTPDRKYSVITSNHRVYRAKHVVVTFSSGVLLANKVVFKPPIPSWKMNSLQKVPMGHYCKFFFQFPYQFWEDSTYIVLATKVRGNYVHWQNMNRAHLFPGSNILLCTLTGQMCKEKQLLSDEVVTKEAMKILRIQKPYKDAPDPIALKRNFWSIDPHVLGAYSLPTAGITAKDYLSLEHPLHNSLWFTGEYANIDHFGYTHGAYEHGVKTAEKLFKCMRYKQCPGELPPQ